MTPQNLPAQSDATPPANFVVGPGAEMPFVERRASGNNGRVSERRQFGSSHTGLSQAGRQLAQAIDHYKVQHHRRYITCDEMLFVLSELGYRRS